MQIREGRASRLKAVMARVTRFGWAAIALVLAVFVIGACTIGGFSAYGDSYFAREKSQVVFYLDYSAAGGGNAEKAARRPSREGAAAKRLPARGCPRRLCFHFSGRSAFRCAHTARRS